MVFRVCLILFIPLLLNVSCMGFVYRLVYNDLDNRLTRNVDDLFDLTGEQKNFVKTRLRSDLEWHREEQLPQYLSILADLEGMVGLEKIDLKHFQAFTLKFEESMLQLYYKLEPTMLHILENLSEEQIMHFEKKLSQKHRKYQKQLQTKPSEELEDRFKKSIKRFKYWVNDLNETQKNDLLTFLRKTPDNRKNWYKKIMQRNNAFLKAVKNKKDMAGLKKELRTLFLKSIRLNRSEALKGEVGRFVVKFSNGLTIEQKKFLVKRLRSLQNNIRYILKG